VAESFPHEQSGGPPIGQNPDFERLVARLKQDEVQLAADQRQLKQVRADLDRAKAELDARRRELDAAVVSLQHERTVFQEQSGESQRTLQAQRDQLQTQQEALTRQTTTLKQTEQDLHARRQQLDDRDRDLQDRQRRLQAQADDLQALQRDLDAARQEHLARQKALDDQQGVLLRNQADLQVRMASLAETEQQRQQDLQDQTGTREQISCRQKELEQQASDLIRGRQQLMSEQGALREQQAEMQRRQEIFRQQQADLETQKADLHRQPERTEGDRRALEQEAQDLEAKRVTFAREQAVFERRQAELADAHKLLQRRQADLTDLQARGDSLAKDRRDLRTQQAELQQQREQLIQAQGHLADRQRHLEELEARLARWQESLEAEKVPDKVAIASVADDLALLAAQAAQSRHRPSSARRLPRPGAGRMPLTAIAGLAALVGLIVGVGLLQGQPARYWLQARIVVAAESPLAGAAELARTQRELTGRLVEARLGGVLLSVDHLPVVADTKTSQLTVQLLTVAPEPSRTALRKVLAEYGAELAGALQDSARARQDRRMADDMAAAQVELARLVAQRQALHAEAEKLQPQEKVYEVAAAAADKVRQDLEQANRKNQDVSARLRVLQRTPPGARVELSPERLAAAAAGDVQLAEVRGQVTARAAELRTLLAGLLSSAGGKCDQMDTQLNAFGAFATNQQGQMSDEALRAETAKIGVQVAGLKGVVQRARSKINDLSVALSKSVDVAQASSLVAVQAQSEKVLESLTAEAADQIRQVEGLLERIPAGGVDVTRRTVLQQRLRSQFSQVQKTQQELTETLNGLRPAVNFRLDAALTAVSGMARRLDERQKVLSEQVQQQDAQQRRQGYDRQVQQARSEQDEISIERDRLIVQLTDSARQMQQVDAGRAQAAEIRGRLDDLDRRIADTRGAVEAGQQSLATRSVAATQPAGVRVDEPWIVEPSINRGVRMAVAVVGGLIAAVLVFAAYTLAAPKAQRRKMPVVSVPELITSRN
jgi:hypothetical protein